jgi:hypothetical protein
MAAIGINDKDLWRYIPPEEKIDLLNQVHARAVLACLITILITATCAIGLRFNWLFWASLIAIPLIFQFVAGKAWRDLRPRLMLEYLAARSVSRRFAFLNQSRSLTPQLIFRAYMEDVYDNELIQEVIDAMSSNSGPIEVWVALFFDTVIIMSERAGGAKLHFAAPLDKLEIQTSSSSGRDYSSDLQIILSYTEIRKQEVRVKLTSKHPGALVVFDKLVRKYKIPLKALLTEGTAEQHQADSGSDDFLALQ